MSEKNSSSEPCDPPQVKSGGCSDKLSFWMSMFAVIISGLSLVLQGCDRWASDRVNKRHVKPSLVHWIQRDATADAPFAPELVLQNNGPIKATAIYVTLSVIAIDTNVFQPIVRYGTVEPGRNSTWLVPELDLNKKVAASLLGVSPMAVIKGELKFYRDTDLQEFREEFLYAYIDGQGFLTEEQFSLLPYYARVKKALEERDSAGTKLPVQFDFYVPSNTEPRLIN